VGSQQEEQLWDGGSGKGPGQDTNLPMILKTLDVYCGQRLCLKCLHVFCSLRSFLQ
jgi:hypothetical protein